MSNYTPQMLVDRCLMIREAENLIGSAMHYDMLAKFNELYESFWSIDEDVCLGINSGYFKGAAAVKAYYSKKAENADAVAGLLMEKWPEKFEGMTKEEAYGAGYVKGNDFHTPIIEVAGDMQSVKCLFQVQAANTNITEKGPLSYWNLSYLCADLVLEGDGLKIKNLLWVNDIDHPVAEPWTSSSSYPDLPDFAELAKLQQPEPTVKQVILEAYHPEREFPQYPDMPAPYETLADTFSYGI